MTDKERKQWQVIDFDYFKPSKGNKCFNEKLSYGRAGEIAAIDILKQNYIYDTFIDTAKLRTSYDIIWYRKSNLIGTIDIKRSTSILKYNTCIFELTDIVNYENKGWWPEAIEEHITYIGFITDDLKTLHMVKVDDVAKHINLNNYKHKYNSNWLSYVPLNQLQQLESYVCLQGGEDND